MVVRSGAYFLVLVLSKGPYICGGAARSSDSLRVLCVALRPLTAVDFDFVLEAESNADERATVRLINNLITSEYRWHSRITRERGR